MGVQPLLTRTQHFSMLVCQLKKIHICSINHCFELTLFGLGCSAYIYIYYKILLIYICQAFCEAEELMQETPSKCNGRTEMCTEITDVFLCVSLTLKLAGRS